MLFRCTLKLRKELGLNDRDIATETFPVADDFTEWYCDVTMTDRHKCVLCTQAQTLYSFIITHVRRQHFVDFGKMFREHLGLNLLSEGLVPNEVEALALAPKGPDIFTKTSSRSILGSMNDLWGMFPSYLPEYGGLDLANVVAINRKLNQAPMSCIKYENGQRMLRKFVEKHFSKLSS